MDEITNVESIPESNFESLSSEEGLFDDYVPEETTDGAEESVETEETAYETEEESAEITPTPEENVQNEFLKVKFNGEERTLTEEEARVLAQKGMNYDRFYEPIERLARMNGMSVGDYVNQLNDTQMEYEVAKEIDSLKEDPRYEDVNEDVLREIAESRVKGSIEKRDTEYANQIQEQADAQQLQVQKEIDKFMEEYPEFKNKGPESLDPKVFQYVQQGYTLLEAYNKFQREMVNQQQMDLKVKASQKNEENRKKSLGNTSNAGNTDDDPFLKGFLAD